MEYLNSVNDKLNSIDESNIKYLDLFEHPEFVFGNLNFNANHVDFCKYPKKIQEEMKNYGEGAVHEMNNLNSASCGNRLRFSTNSKKVVFKVKLKRKWDNMKMVTWGSMGFDIYNIFDDNYIHMTVFAPMDGKDCFAEIVSSPRNGQFCVFLPNYNTIEEMHIGIEENSHIESIPYPSNKQLPILFYGNSVTQGASASRSANTFPNFVSRMLNRNIINLSCSSCCQGTQSIAELIGQINCHSIVIDYTRNANDKTIFSKTHESFYQKIREFHPDIKIILMTASYYNGWVEYENYDKIVIDTYNNAIARNENTFLLKQRDLFNEEDYDCVTIDSSHYIDYSMFKVAKAICKLLE